MTSIDKNPCDAFEATSTASTRGDDVWSGLIGLDLDSQGRGGASNDTLVVLLIAVTTICGFSLLGAVLFMKLQ